jgi:ferrous iron transport protein B
MDKPANSVDKAIPLEAAAQEASAEQAADDKPSAGNAVLREIARTARVALAGNPNSGKTSIFNALTGSRQHVGNYPGVTVEKREGSYRSQGGRCEVLDLPGTYSLTSFSPEERIAQQQLLDGHADVVVAVVDATALKRSLLLLAQIMQLGANPVLCLNMSDEARRAGQVVDIRQLQALLGFPVVETVGHRAIGIDKLKEAVDHAVEHPVGESRLVLGGRVAEAIEAITEKLAPSALEPRALRWYATGLLTADREIEREVLSAGQAGQEALQLARRQRERIEADTGMEITLFVIDRFYGFVDGLLREVVQSPPRADARALSDRIDSVLAHRLLGLPFFLAAMYLIFWLTFTAGEAPMGWIEAGFEWLAGAVGALWPAGSASPLRSLLIDGVIAGVGGVVIFLPNILLLFFGLAVLEDTGYMARAAFLVDSFMHRFGLHGKSFIPMLTGFGCTIPGVMATRTLENERDRLTTMMVLPLMSCGARLPIWMLLIPAFFPVAWRAPALWFIYMFGIMLALVLALVLRKSILRGADAPFVMELPPYRVPTARAVVIKMFERGWLYLRKAGTIILAISILMWIASSYPKMDEAELQLATASARAADTAAQQEPVEHIEAAVQLRHSVAGRIGGALEPLFAPLGFDWRIVTGMIGAFAAKELFVSQMGIVYALGETDETSTSLRETLSRDYSPLVGLSLMLFLLIATPCMATVAVTRRESGSWKWALLQLGGLTAVAYVVSLVVYQLGQIFL